LRALRLQNLFLTLALISATPIVAESFELLPSGRPFRLTFADPQEIRMMLSADQNSKIQAIVGNYFSLIGMGGEKDDTRVHLGLEGRGYFTLRQEGTRFPLETVDGMFGAYLEAKFGVMQIQTRYTHVSAHIADGLPVQSQPFSREYFTFRVGYVPDNNFQLYAGISEIANAYPSVPKSGLQTGGHYFLPLPFWLTPYVGWDLQWKEEWQKTGITVQLGLAINNTTNRYKSFRLFYNYYSGGDTRGQFYGQPMTTHSLGLEMQL
jgi:hypothetical protein